MTTPHKATPEQWAWQEEWAREPHADHDASCILELRDRLAALEAGATCPHIISSDEGTSYCQLAEQGSSSAGSAGSPAPADPRISLVATVDQAMFDARTETMHEAARAAILAVAEWFDAIGYGATASILRQELQRHG